MKAWKYGPNQSDSIDAFENVISERANLLHSLRGSYYASLDSAKIVHNLLRTNLRWILDNEKMNFSNLKFISKVSKNNLHINGTERIKGYSSALPIAIHGLCHNNLCFIDLTNFLDMHGIPLQSISWPGAGFSREVPKIPMKEMLVEDYLNSLENCIRRYRRKVLLIGHSVGGLLAQKLAARMPERVKGLVLLASNPPTNLRQRIKTLPEADSVKKAFRDGLFFPALLPEWRENELFKPNPYEVDKLMGSRTEIPTRFQSMILDFEYAGAKFITDYAREGGTVGRDSIQCPILEIEGEKDVNETALCHPMSKEIIEHELDGDKRKSLVKFFGKDESEGRTVIIPDAAHNMMMASDSQKTADLIADAIKSGFFPEVE